MNPAMNELNAFLSKIFDSIKYNLTTLNAPNEKTIEQVRRQSRDFYVSLFSREKGRKYVRLMEVVHIFLLRCR